MTEKPGDIYGTLTEDLDAEMAKEFPTAKPSGQTDGFAGTRPVVSGTNGAKGIRPLPPMPGSTFSVGAAKRVEGYENLERILDKAYEQSAKGKGHERHAHSPVGFRAWIDQPILANARQVGPAGPGQQVMKKTQEAVMMASRKDFAGAKAEMLGAIVYAAALYRLLEEMELVK